LPRPEPQRSAEGDGGIEFPSRFPLRSQGGDYADTHARYDDVTVKYFADIAAGGGSRGVILSNPDLAFAKPGRSTTTALDTTTPLINFLAGGQVDGPNLGVRGQNRATDFL